ncbi:DUF4178 domain-containing protein [Novosphingobium umbonatum]|uniref:DUF4178 domain-containing protein n=1 Tax=Novosphingobium umbonatum TaxID=1908524 RepID=A0A3S2USS7_9SPHN|nr:DUF4178 domain-containing protein [Novosphingobium umbonatum]RVU05348.1 DUF4178 domain-containing protein [Novosphingobium umbonatum]
MSRAVTCPCCGGGIEVKAAGYTVSVACQYCGSLLDVAHPDVKVIAEYHQKLARLALPLGSRGALFGTQWEVIGWLAREASGYGWEEYLLFNPYAGYRWLVYSNGHWQFGQMLTAHPKALGDGTYGWASRRFGAEEDGAATITTKAVLGEFYWRVRAGEQVFAESFISGDGQSLSREANGEEVQWTHLVPLPSWRIRSFTRRQGPSSANPPSRFAAWWADFDVADTSLPNMAGIALATVMAANLLLTAMGSPSLSQRGQGQVTVDGAAAAIPIGAITLARPKQFVTIKVESSNFVNQWVDLDYRLVNRQTQAVFTAPAALEYYTGVDSDGTWSEGSHSAETLFEGVPAGQYDVVVEASAHSWNDPTRAAPTYTNPFQTTPDTIGLAFLVEDGGMAWGLWWLVVAGAGLPVLWVALKHWSRTR